MDTIDRTMALLVGEDPGAFYGKVVRRVLELAVEKGHEDPRHRQHWWDWKDWPFDSRQWERIEGGRYKLDRGMVAEKKERAKMEGCLGSKLKVERTLEGMIWDTDKPWTALRSTAAIDVEMLEEGTEVGDDEEEIEEEDVDRWFRLPMTAWDLEERHAWDASVNGGIRRTMNINGDIIKEFHNERPLEPFLKRFSLPVYYSDEEFEELTILQVKMFQCTDAFPTRDEQQQREKGSGAVSIFVGLPYYDLEADKPRMVCVVAEAPIPLMKDELFDRVAGFCFYLDKFGDDKLPAYLSPDAVEDEAVVLRATYVEAAGCDYESLKDTQKDSLLEDRALVLHRLLHRVAKPAYKTLFSPLQVRTPPYGSKEPRGFPPPRTLQCYATITRADPRWPLLAPNSVCLNCGKGPKHSDESMRVESLLNCSKCRVRKFCSRECQIKSWKDPVWPHSYECKKAHEQSLCEVGTSHRERMMQIDPSGRAMDLLEQVAGEDVDLDCVATSVEELHEKREAREKKQRAAARKKRKKGKGRKKR